MGFNTVKVVGNGVNQEVIPADPLNESIVYNIIVTNTANVASSLQVLVGSDVILSETVNSNTTIRLTDKINIPVGSSCSTVADLGLECVFLFYANAVDVSAGMTYVQTKVQEASAEADRAETAALAAENALPAGTLDDTIVSIDRAWSSSKIDSELTLKADKANPVFTGSITEQVGTMTTAIDATLGTIQELTMTADTVLTDNLLDGQSVTLILTNGGFTVTYPLITWVGGAEPKLSATDIIVFFKAGGVLYGSWNGATA